MRVNAPLIGVLAGAGVGSVSTGMVLSFLLADIGTARGYGTGQASTALTALATGTILGSWAGGRFPTRAHPAVAAGAKAAVAASMVFIAFAGGLPLILLACLLLGVAISLGRPAISAMLLRHAPAGRRRDVFGWFFILMNAGMAAGAGYGGLAADLHHRHGMRSLYLTAAAVSIASAVIIAASARPPRNPATPATAKPPARTKLSLAQQLRVPGLPRVYLLHLVLALALYAQFNAGLPALILTGLHAGTHIFGTAVAVNAGLVAALTAPVIALTRNHGAGRLLAGSSLLWLTGWALLGLPLWTHAPAGGMVLIALIVLAIGETTVAPVMTPLAASLVEDDHAAAVTATMATIFTTATTIGPIAGGALFAITGPTGFLYTQLALCATALLLAIRLPRPGTTPTSTTPGPAAEELPTLTP
jgi:MFS family permease